MKFFSNLGISEIIKEKAQAINDIIVSDGTLQDGASEQIIHFDAHDIHQDAFGYFALNSHIHLTLLEEIQKYSNITLSYHTTIENIEHTPTSVNIKDTTGNMYHGRLLVAADGKKSFIRDHFNIEVKKTDYNQTAIVLAVSHTKPHHGIAQEFFLPSGPFAILPLQGNQVSLVFTESHHIAHALLNAPQDVFLYELQRRFGDYLGDLTVASQKFSYPLMRQISQNLYAERSVFIGDAAHAIHPISGQGFNLGLRDIGFLIELVHTHHYAGLDIGSEQLGLEYEKNRKQDIHLLANVTHGLNGLFSNDYMIVQSARRLGLDIVNHIPKLRNFFSKGASAGSINPVMNSLKAFN